MSHPVVFGVIWLRHNLACFKDRLKALEALVAQEGRILTESQMAAMERKQQDDVAAGEIETAHPQGNRLNACVVSKIGRSL